MLPRMILARYHLSKGQSDLANNSAWVTNKNAAILPPQHQAAWPKLDGLTTHDIVDPSVYKQRAQLLLEASQPALSLSDLRQYQSAHPEDAESWILHGQIQLVLDHPAKAIAAYLVGRKHSPDHSPAWEGLVTIAFQQADYPTAEACYQWLLDREPSNFMPNHYNNDRRITNASRHDPSPPFLSNAILPV